jgi:pimeloyl-ACP methyl ester carboxylesterase
VDTLVELYRQSAALARVAWNPYLYNPLLRRRLARITAPTLLCWGRHDRLAPPHFADAWVKEMPGARLITFEESGHVPHLEQPEAVAAAIAEFCGSRGGAR